MSKNKRVMNLASINRRIVDFQYAVRGPQAILAESLSLNLASNPNFSKIIFCNIGNPQQLGQKPLTFFRQVLAAVEYPPLLSLNCLPKDVIKRANTLLKATGSVGAYTNSQGILHIRRRICEYLEKRDGVSSDAEDIFLTAGASPGVQNVLMTLIAHEKCGIMMYY